MTPKCLSSLFLKKAPVAKCEELIEELLRIAKNKAEYTNVLTKTGCIQRDEVGLAVKKLERPYNISNQIVAIKIVLEYTLGKPSNSEPEQEVNKGGGVIVILPSNDR